MRIKGIIKVLALLAIDFAVISSLFNAEAAAVVTAFFALFAWLGEYFTMLKDGAISEKKLNEHDKLKLIRARAILEGEAERMGGKLPSFKLHLVQSNEANAFAYGISNIAITRGTLQCDDITLAAVIAHEVSHTANLDAVMSRLMFINITATIIGISVLSFLTTVSIWVIFMILALVGIGGGLFSVLITNLISKGSKGIFRGLQYIVLFLYQAIIGTVNKFIEYRCDRFAAQIGLGQNLAYFLNTYVQDQDARQRSLRDILYASHPATYKRVLKLEEHTGC